MVNTMHNYIGKCSLTVSAVLISANAGSMENEVVEEVVGAELQ